MRLTSFLSALLLSFVFVPQALAANVDAVTPTKFFLGDTVIVTGSNLGNYQIQGNLAGTVCWGNTCIDPADIDSWSNTEIIFTMNTRGMDNQGILSVKFIDPCQQQQGDNTCTPGLSSARSGVTVSVHPYVEDILFEGESLPYPGNVRSDMIIEIIGDYFGDVAGGVYFENKIGVIKSWANNRIIIGVPFVEKTTTTMTVATVNGIATGLAINNIFAIKDDPYFYLQDYLTHINMQNAWLRAPTLGEGVTVAIIDSGLNTDHPDLKDALWLNEDEIPNNLKDDDGNGYVDDHHGYDFVGNVGQIIPYTDHGTMVAGIIAAKTGNKIGITGIAENANIMSLSACNPVQCEMKDIVEAMHYAIDNGANIINLSLGGPQFNTEYNEDLDSALRKAYLHNVTVVAAAGNGDFLSEIGLASYGSNLDINPKSPVCNDGDLNYVIGVGSYERDWQKSDFSDYGKNCLDISAYGRSIMSLSHPTFSPYGEYNLADGTSFAVPQVTGVLALLKGQFPDLTNWEMSYALKNGANLDEHLPEEYQGTLGMALDAERILSRAIEFAPKPGITRVYKTSDSFVIEGSYFNPKTAVILSLGDGEGKKYSSAFLNPGTLVLPVETVNTMGDHFQLKLSRTDRTVVQDSDPFDVTLAQLESRLKVGEDIQFIEREFDEESDSPSSDEQVPSSGESGPFSDMTADHKYASAVSYLKDKKVIAGYPDGSFKPEQHLNRAELTKIVITGQNIEPDASVYQNCFPDVTNEWFAPYVCYAKEQGFIAGYPDGTFKPAQMVNKAEAIKIVLGALGVTIPSGVQSHYGDVAEADWFYGFVNQAFELGLLEEQGNYFPGTLISRGQVSENLYRLIYILKNALGRFDVPIE